MSSPLLRLLRSPQSFVALALCLLLTFGARGQEAEAEAEVSYTEESVAELVEILTKERDEVDRGVLDELASRGTLEAAEALSSAYDLFASVYMRRAVLLRLHRFDSSEDGWEPALERLVEVAIRERRRDIRSTAVEGLGKARTHGKPFLARLVESTAPDEYRERALELHVRLKSPEDEAWYRALLERDMSAAQKELSAKGKKAKKKKKGRPKRGEAEAPEPERTPIVWPSGRIRAAALRAIADDMEEAELQKLLKETQSLDVAMASLAELAKRDSKTAITTAEDFIKRPDYPSEIRELAAEIIVDKKGPSCAREMIDLALKTTTPARLKDRIADLIAGMDDEKVQKQIAKLVGKGKGDARIFAIRAATNIDDPKLLKKFRKDIKNKDEAVAAASIANLAARRDRESVEGLEKLLDKTKSNRVRQALLRALSAIYDGENAWVERLIDYSANEDLDLANLAVDELAQLGRTNMLDLFVERLEADTWSTRLTALKALEGLRRPEVVPPIIERMQSETGRMLSEYSEVLFRLTGQSFGRRADTWARWLKDNRDGITILSERELAELIKEIEERDLRRISQADLDQPDFFGISIDSTSVLFIIDVSGSMAETLRPTYEGEQGRVRIDVAKEELTKAIKALDPEARFNILAFSTGVDSFADSVESGSRDEALEYVSRLGAAGGTNLFGALRQGFTDTDVDTILLLSDGEPSAGEIVDPGAICDEIRRRNETRGIVIHTIAVGGQLEALKWLARDSGGTYAGVR